MAGVLLLALAVLAGGALAVASAGASLTADSRGLARVGLPLGGGRIQSVLAVTGPHSQRLDVEVRDGRVWPKARVAAGERITVDVVVKRPSWIAWLAGSTQHLRLDLVAPQSRPSQDYVTVAPGAPLRLTFTEPVSAVAYGASAGQLSRDVLPAPSSQVTLPRSGEAGSVWVAGLPRSWETAPARPVSWFPAGAATTAVASPAPGTPIRPWTPLTLTFSKPVSQALGGSMPPVSPVTPGTWHLVDRHTIVFHPRGYGYGLGADVRVALPAGVRVAGGRASGSSAIAAWTVPPGSTLRLQQLLATLGYLPFRFSPSTAVPATLTGQETAAITPPPGNFSWRYSNPPDGLRALWAPGASGVMTRGAVMAFESDHGLGADGDPGPQVWRSLIAAAVAGRTTSFGYTFVSVDKASQRLNLWHSGQTVLSTPVNTGIATAPTASGTFPVYEHIRSGTMSGTNPDGSHYNDHGIQFISYFNGGDALHAFTRAQYGFPQSLGCVEMALGPAGQVWPYTPIGTLVHVA